MRFLAAFGFLFALGCWLGGVAMILDGDAEFGAGMIFAGFLLAAPALYVFRED